MPENSSALQALLDRDAIEQVLIKYVNTNDADDWDGMVSCFSEKGSFGQMVGRVALKAAFSSMRKLSSTMMPVDEVKRSMHVLSNVEIELNGDTAKAYSIARAYLLGQRGSEVVLLVRGFTYDDEMVRENGEWLILKRTHTLKWMFETRPIQATPDLRLLETI